MKFCNKLGKDYLKDRMLYNYRYFLEKDIFDWEKYVKYDKYEYNRKLLYRDENIEMLLLCWEPYQYTKLHNHSCNGCLMKILKGNLGECIFSHKGLTFNDYKVGDISYIDNKIGNHIIQNNDKNSVSLHIYSPPYMHN